MIAPEIDNLDEEQESASGSGGSSRIVLWLILLGLGILFVPVYMAGITITETKGSLETEYAQIQSTLAITPRPNPTEEALTGSLVQIRGQIGELENIQTDLSAAHIDWPSVMAIIASYDQAQMGITGLAQAQRNITLNGWASNEQVVMTYAELLRQSNQFADVTIRSIALVPPATPTVTRNTTPMPSTPASTTANFILTLMLKDEVAS